MSVFKFKQFEVDQSACAMKINTDGVLLAAMVESVQADYILDIGTGTGVIALMLAQRFVHAKVHAVEIDAAAAATASKNFQLSVFKDRLTCDPIAIENFNPIQQFDLIVSNPPFFVNDLKNAEEKKGIARHASEVFFEELMAKVNVLLTADGLFWIILPIKQAEDLVKIASAYGLLLQKQINLHSDVSKPTFRQILCLSRRGFPVEIKDFYIYESEKVYTGEYKEVLKDFFLGY